ncbi:MAG TPA: queuosine salvage family protein, partial [Solirubrobacteraceae bacterium]|nr:queuosine salvage family protein [Solirubrobacteraceae bacterium]
MVISELKSACAWVSARARHVRIREDRISAYAATLPAPEPECPAELLPAQERESAAAFWLTLDAINFGSGWFPTLRKRLGPTGYRTIATGIRRRFDSHGPWAADELARLQAGELAAALDQDPEHELMALFARSLNDLGAHLAAYGGSFAAVADSADGSAVALVETLAGWECFADCSSYEGRAIPFLKRAQIAAADLSRGAAARFGDLHELTLFADNLVPHVLRLDGVLWFAPELVARIERG